MQAYKLGDLHNLMMGQKVKAPYMLGNGHDWNRGYEAGYYKSQQDMSLIAIRYEAYTKELEKMLTAVGVHENILAQIQKELLL